MQGSTVKAIKAHLSGQACSTIVMYLAMMCGGGCIVINLQNGLRSPAPLEATACLLGYITVCLLAIYLSWHNGEVLRKETGFSSITLLLEAEGDDA